MNETCRFCKQPVKISLDGEPVTRLRVGSGSDEIEIVHVSCLNSAQLNRYGFENCTMSGECDFCERDTPQKDYFWRSCGDEYNEGDYYCRECAIKEFQSPEALK